MFDALINEYPETACRLSSTSHIVHSPLFDSAIVKIQSENIRALPREEKNVTVALKITEHCESDVDDAELSFVQHALCALSIFIIGQFSSVFNLT